MHRSKTRLATLVSIGCPASSQTCNRPCQQSAAVRRSTRPHAEAGSAARSVHVALHVPYEWNYTTGFGLVIPARPPVSRRSWPIAGKRIFTTQAAKHQFCSVAARLTGPVRPLARDSHHEIRESHKRHSESIKSPIPGTVTARPSEAVRTRHGCQSRTTRKVFPCRIDKLR
jgi:hypothetical protein